MFIFNLAFMTDRSLENQLLIWLRSCNFTNPENEFGISPDHSPRFVEVAEVEGQPDYTAEALNISIQLHFNSLEEARLWGNNNLPAIRTILMQKFGDRVMAFATILLHREKL